MKYLFFDVDGTLLPFGRGVPDDTRAALAAAQENGNLIFLSTGRSPAEMDPRLGVISFDGGVCSGGARAFADGRGLCSVMTHPGTGETSVKCMSLFWTDMSAAVLNSAI